MYNWKNFTISSLSNFIYNFKIMNCKVRILFFFNFTNIIRKKSSYCFRNEVFMFIIVVFVWFFCTILYKLILLDTERRWLCNLFFMNKIANIVSFLWSFYLSEDLIVFSCKGKILLLVCIDFWGKFSFFRLNWIEF